MVAVVAVVAVELVVLVGIMGESVVVKVAFQKMYIISGVRWNVLIQKC